MTIELKLDTPSLTSLFPEGSEARLKLQQAVIDNFCRRHLRGVASDIESRLESARLNTIREAEAAFTVALPGRMPQRKLSPEFSKLIEDEVRTAANQQMRDALSGAIEAAFAELNIEARVQSYLDARIRNMTSTAIEQALKERFAAAMATLNA